MFFVGDDGDRERIFSSLVAGREHSHLLLRPHSVFFCRAVSRIQNQWGVVAVESVVGYSKGIPPP